MPTGHCLNQLSNAQAPINQYREQLKFQLHPFYEFVFFYSKQYPVGHNVTFSVLCT